MTNRILTEKSNFPDVTMPQPLVSEISVYSPPPKTLPNEKIQPFDDVSKQKIKTNNKFSNKPPAGSGNRSTTTHMASKSAPSKQINVAKSSFPGKKAENNSNSDFTELKLQLKQQNSEINELKQLVRQLAVQKLIESESKSDTQPILPKKETIPSNDSPKTLDSKISTSDKISAPVAKVFVDAGVQNDGICPHCDKSLTLESVPKQPKRIRVADHLKANAAKNALENLSSDASFVTMHEPGIRIDAAELSMLNPQTDSYSQPMHSPDHQFIDRMLGAAQKWLKPQASNAQISSKNVRNGRFSPTNQQINDINQEPANRYWSLLAKECEDSSQGVSMEINSLAMRYLTDDRPTSNRHNNQQKWPSSNRNQNTFGVVGPASPMAVATHRQTVTMESEVSLVGMVPQNPNAAYESSSEMSLSSAEFLRRHGLTQNFGVRGALQSNKYGSIRNGPRRPSNHHDFCTSALSTITERSSESRSSCTNKMRHVCDCCKIDEFDCESDLRSDNFDCKVYKTY